MVKIGAYRNAKSGKDYEVYITEELPKVIQWMFPASKKREDTYIAGLSMGGGGAVRLGLSHPEVYGYTIGLSADFGLITENVKNNGILRSGHAFEGVDLDADETSNSYKLAEKRDDGGKKTEQGCILHVAIQKTSLSGELPFS